MKRCIRWSAVLFILAGMLSACGSTGSPAANDSGPAASLSSSPSAEETVGSTNDNPAGHFGEPPEEEMSVRTIEYLGDTYTVPAHVERIVITGSMEAHEDALMLDVHPVGAVTYSGKFPERFAPITDQAVSIGEKAEPNFETILELDPDVILGTTKFPEETKEKLGKISTLIPVSHIATNWKDNLLLLGELTGKTGEAEQIIAAYQSEADAARQVLSDKIKDKQAVALRLRNGQLFMYAPSIFFNPILYEDLGFPVPDAVAASKSQEAISVEQLAAMNPDYIFLQFAEEENTGSATALGDGNYPKRPGLAFYPGDHRRIGSGGNGVYDRDA